MDELVAEDFVAHNPLPGQMPGREGLKAAMRSVTESFPDAHWTIDEQIAQAETVVSRFSLTGTHGGQFAGFSPTNKPFAIW